MLMKDQSNGERTSRAARQEAWHPRSMSDGEAQHRLQRDPSSEPTLPDWLRFFSNVDEQGLLSRLDAFPGAILIGGCQRSGTTALAEVVAESDGMVRYWSTPGIAELTAARILAGIEPCEPEGRYCFQTTYLGQHIDYYSLSEAFQVIWMIRNPYSTVRSLVYNWPAAALSEVFSRAVVPTLPRRKWWERRWTAMTQLEKACLHYRSKLEQMLRLFELRTENKLLAVDYDDLVLHADQRLPVIYEFVGLPYRLDYARRLHPRSLQKQDDLTPVERRAIEGICGPIYRRARRLAVPPS